MRSITPSMPAEEVAKLVLMFYMQSWGQSLGDRIRTLQGAVDWCGIKATFVQDSVTGHAGWAGDDRWHTGAAVLLRQELESCMVGRFESEVQLIAQVLTKYRREFKRWWEFWK